MDFFKLLEKRRSVRDYEDKPVPLHLIQEMIDDGIKAPNAGNMQLWRFVVVNDKGVPDPDNLPIPGAIHLHEN